LTPRLVVQRLLMNPIALIFGRRGGPPGLARARGNSRAHGNYATPKIDVRAAVFDRNARILLVRETADDGRRTLPGGSSGCKLPMPFMIRARALLPPFGACRVPSGPLNGPSFDRLCGNRVDTAERVRNRCAPPTAGRLPPHARPARSRSAQDPPRLIES
jgi:hypothetical protein